MDLFSHSWTALRTAVAGTEPARNAVTCWDVADTPPTGEDPLDALVPRPATAYGEPPAEPFTAARAPLEEIAGTPFPASFSDQDALLVGTGRRAPSGAEKAALGDFAGRRPLVLG